ncbi:hypothetical protein [Helicobacter ailurogastricus]|uniref:hypothetical protein n=1 Tax=Helicobacter ailurogastricus TaxID=1578720 RepID=UPI002555FD48|nr:hypothetical protein [Helicobacter ailurogastricus]
MDNGPLYGENLNVLTNRFIVTWVCIQKPARRIQEAEVKLDRLIQGRRIPTIVGITKAQQDKDGKGVAKARDARNKAR